MAIAILGGLWPAAGGGSPGTPPSGSQLQQQTAAAAQLANPPQIEPVVQPPDPDAQPRGHMQGGDTWPTGTRITPSDDPSGALAPEIRPSAFLDELGMLEGEEQAVVLLDAESVRILDSLEAMHLSVPDAIREGGLMVADAGGWGEAFFPTSPSLPCLPACLPAP